MGLISLPYTFVDGTLIIASETNQNNIAITTQVNGNLNSANLLASGVAAVNLQNNSVTSRTVTGDVFLLMQVFG